ncbi:MAG: TadE/TadG family type IV pilus assembly protein [Verrucomicrobiota bacterium]
MRCALGQALLEFALAVPIFLVMMFGLVDLARYYFTEQSISHTLRAAGRYAVTGQLMSNTSYATTNTSSFPYKDRRSSIVATAQQNNPAGISIEATPSGYNSNDTFVIMSSTNFNGPWLTNSSSGIGGEYIKLQLTYQFYFVTPFLNQICAAANNGTPFSICGSIIMKNEEFQTNAYSPANGTGATTNYWN